MASPHDESEHRLTALWRHDGLNRRDTPKAGNNHSIQIDDREMLGQTAREPSALGVPAAHGRANGEQNKRAANRAAVTHHLADDRICRRWRLIKYLLSTAAFDKCCARLRLTGTYGGASA